LKEDRRWCAFSWSVCDRNCHIIRCLESDDFQGYVGIHESWEGNISGNVEWVKTNIDRMKSGTLRRIVTKNHRTTAAQVTAELNIHLDDSVSAKTVRREFYKSNIHGRAATAEPLITESNAQMGKRRCHDHKTWTSDNCKRARDMARCVVLHAVPYIRRVYVWRTPKKAYNLECLFRFQQ
jgi:hypothetical protein